MTALTEAALSVRYIIAGQYATSKCPEELRTLLGSCVAACLYDLATGVGGMNHFILPAGDHHSGESARFGGYAMELLITDIMKHGGDRRRLKAKIFGGAEVLSIARGDPSVGNRNVTFVREYLEAESIPIVASSVGGNSGVRVHFWPHNGRAFIQRLQPSKLKQLHAEELQSRRALNAAARTRGGEVVLF